jgi:large subunit ribosomal protein L4
MKAAALRGALSDRARAGRVHVVEGLVEGDRPSTKAAVAALRGLVDSRKVLVVLERGDNLTWLSLRNESSVHLLAVDQLNTYDVLVSDDVVFTKGAYDVFVAGPQGGKAVKAVGTAVGADDAAHADATTDAADSDATADAAGSDATADATNGNQEVTQ